MKPIEHFRFCPRCGQHYFHTASDQMFRCPACGFVYYFNPAIAAAAFIRNSAGQTLFIRRAKEPAKGQLAIPGGFVDVGETAETALRREIREEVDIEIDALGYLCSQTNEYAYKEVTYPVLDLFFVAEISGEAKAAALDGVESCTWLEASRVDPEGIAFPSIRAALALFLRGVGKTLA